jgi:hypothetical protein
MSTIHDMYHTMVSMRAQIDMSRSEELPVEARRVCRRQAIERIEGLRGILMILQKELEEEGQGTLL